MVSLLLCINTTAAGLLLPARRRTSACSVAPSTTISLRRRSLPARGLCCAGADWADLSFVGVTDKPDEEGATPARVSAGVTAGEEEEEFGAINDVGGAAVQEHVVVPFAPLEQSLVTVDSVRGETLSQGIGTKENRDELLVEIDELKRRIIG